MKYHIVLLALLFAANHIFADETSTISDDTLVFKANSKLYDCALISGLRQNTQLQLIQNNRFELYQSLFGIPYSINYSLDGVELNSMIDGGINLINFNGSYYKSPKISTASGFSPIPTMELTSGIPEKSSFSAFTHFGNTKLLANIEAIYRKNNFFILTHANYNNQNVYKVPERINDLTIDSNNNLLNSEFEGRSIFIKSGIIEDYSELTAEYLHVNNYRNIPLNYTSSVPEYLREKQYKMNLLSIIYKSKLTSNASLRGNFYYCDNKRILDSYDDSSYLTQQTEISYRNLTKEQIIGFDISTKLDLAKIGLSEIGAFFKRMQLYEKANYNMKSYDYVNEILGLKWSQAVPISEKFALNTNIVYKYINPVYPANNGLKHQSLVEYSIAIMHKLGDNFQYSASYSKNGTFPYIKYIYSKNAPVLDNNFCDIAQLNFDLKLFDIPIQLNGFYSGFSNYFKNSGEIARLTGKTIGSGITLQKQTKYVNFNLAYTYLKQLETNTLFPKFPENNFYLSLGKEYSIGLKWQIESRMLIDLAPNQTTAKLLDIWIQQKIIKNINVFFYADNILNEYYELCPGFPAQGFNFCFGFNFEI
ncbi:MAG: hypothetical protein WCR42_10190 [bacterium]